MRVVIFGASGMVGQGVLRACLEAPDVTRVLCIGRSPLKATHPKLEQLQHADIGNYFAIADKLGDLDACFYTLGASAAGLSEAEYRRINYDGTMAAARVLAERNPGMTFIYVSGVGTDSSEKGRIMWARVKGKTENDLQKLSFKAVYLFRPGIIMPAHGEKSRTRLYRMFYAIGGLIVPLIRLFAPRSVLTTQIVGDAMLNAVRHGAPKAALEPVDIHALGTRVS